MGKRIHRSSSAQEILESPMSGRKIRGEYRRLAKMANARLERLKEAGFEASEFYQNHKQGFAPEVFGSRKEVAMDLAEVNRFLNSQSSTVSGLKKARENLADAMNRLYGTVETVEGEEIVDGPFDLNNIDKFGRFMKKWRDKYKDQMDLSSDKAVDMFIAQERLQLSEGEIWKNVDIFLEHEDEIDSWSAAELMERRGVKNGSHRFRFSSYRKAFGL